jgi:Fe-S-cluster containining protein
MTLPPPPEGSTLFAWFWEVAQFAESQPDQLALIYPEQVDQFECSQCAQCCQQPWNIEIDQIYFERWYALFEAHPTGRFSQPFLQHTDKSKPGGVLRKQAGTNRCLFLDDDNLCFIHKHYGAESKPEICQNYPREASLQVNLYSPSLKSSCKTAAQMLAQTGELVLRMVNRPETLPQINKNVLLDKTSLPANSLVLWQGLLLEGVWQHSISPVRCLLGSVQALQEIAKEPNSLTDIELLNQLYLKQVAFWREDTGLKRLNLNECIDLFSALDPFQAPALERFLAKIKSSNHLPIEVKDSDRQLMATVLRNYLTRRLLNLNPLQAKELSLFQFVFLQAFSLLAIQVQALCLSWYGSRQLTLENLVSAINQVETAILQNPAWFDRHHFNKIDSDTCLAAIRAATRLDLCLPEITE